MVNTVFCSSFGFCLFSRSRLNTFSTSTIASSTKEPIAIAIPPKLMVLIVNPMNLRESMAKTNESGIVTSEITVVRAFIKKITNMITTKIPPSYKDFCTLLIELSMKRAWRKISVEIFTSAGNVCCNSARDSSSLSVKSSVLVAGCLVIVINTAGLPSFEAIPSLGALSPICTSAMFSKSMGISLTVLMTALPNAETLLVESTPRMIYSFPYSYKTPPAAF